MKIKKIGSEAILKSIKPFTFMLVLPLFGLLYNAFNNDYGTVYSLVTDLDKMIPFSKYFVVPYVLWYPYIFLMMVYFCMKDKRAYFTVLITLAAGLTVNLITYGFFQTTVSRPEILGHDVFSNLVRLVYTMDRPYNCFPSGHVLTSYAIMYGAFLIKDINKGIFYLSQGMGILIIISTQLMKQHTLLDAIASIVIVNVIMSLINVLRKKSLPGQVINSRIEMKENYGYNESVKRI